MDDSPLSKLPELATVVAGTAMAFSIAMLRGLYDSKEPRFLRVLLEAIICSGITVTAIAVMFMVFPSLSNNVGLAVTVGGGCGAFVGFLGVYQIRRIILKILNQKLKDD